MKTKNLVLTVLSFVLVAVLAIGGTLAYFTDRESKANVFTVGDVEIRLDEDFDQGATLTPGVNIEKKPTITNTGKNDAWVWLTFSIPSALDNWNPGTDEGSNENVIHWNPLGATAEGYVTDARVTKAIADGHLDASLTADKILADNMTWNVFNSLGAGENVYTETINGVAYNTYVLLYNKALTPGETTLTGIYNVFLDSRVDITPEGDWYFVENGVTKKIEWNSNTNGNPVIYVSAYAMQKENFETVNDAYAAYNKQWEGNNGVEEIHVVSNLDELKAAFAEGGDIILTDDIKFDKITAIEPGVEVYLNLNGNTITVDENTTSNTMIWVKDGAKLTIDGNGTIDMGAVSTMAIFAPYGELVIENGTFIRDKVTEVTNKTTGLFMGSKSTGSNVTINGGYFDPGYYDKNAADIEGILAGTVEFTETADDIAKRGNSKDTNLVRTAIKDNVSVLLNHSGYGSFKVYGGTFVGANPAWGDEGCMLPTTPNYLRPWSYYQGALLDGQTFNENGIVLPEGYSITQSTTEDGIPVYTVNYNK